MRKLVDISRKVLVCFVCLASFGCLKGYASSHGKAMVFSDKFLDVSLFLEKMIGKRCKMMDYPEVHSFSKNYMDAHLSVYLWNCNFPVGEKKTSVSLLNEMDAVVWIFELDNIKPDFNELGAIKTIMNMCTNCKVLVVGLTRSKTPCADGLFKLQEFVKSDPSFFVQSIEVVNTIDWKGTDGVLKYILDAIWSCEEIDVPESYLFGRGRAQAGHCY